jgi:hypothetical protein
MGHMAKTPPPEKTPSADDEAKQQNALPMMPPTTAPKDTGTAKEAAADPLAKWREAREMEEEMSDLFDEDRVTHRHGGTEPEAD